MSTQPRSHRAARTRPARHLTQSRVPRASAAVAVASAITLLAGALAFAGPGFRADNASRLRAADAAVTAAASEQSLWPSTAKPGTLADPDRTSVELGVRFSASQDGSVTGVRFYKSRQNTGTHTGSLWSSTGQKLAGVTFTGETGSGWQTARFAKPVPVKAGSTYVVSYHTNVGAYSVDEYYFDKARTSGALTAPGSANGVYKYGSSGFPTKTWKASNYWVDLLFAPSTSSTGVAAPTTTSAAPTTTSAAPTTTSAAPTTTSAAPTTTSAAPTTTSAAPTTTSAAPTTSAPAPSGGWPDASTTGVVPGTSLTTVNGGVTLDKAGTVYENKLVVNGSIEVTASNVTIRNVKIVGKPGGTNWIVVPWWQGVSGVRIEHVEIDGQKTSDQAAIGNGGYTCLYCNIHDTGDGFRAEKDVLIQDSFVHDLAGPDNSSLSWAHNDGVQTTGASNISIVHNRIENPNGETSTIMLGNEFGPIKNVKIDRNLLAGGGYSLYGGWGGDMATYPVSDISVTNNVWSRKFFPKGGYYGPVAYFNPDGPGMVWTNNTWTDGTAVNP
jgi:hypothetical protein